MSSLLYKPPETPDEAMEEFSKGMILERRPSRTFEISIADQHAQTTLMITNSNHVFEGQAFFKKNQKVLPPFTLL